jgi:hypothetical protein
VEWKLKLMLNVDSLILKNLFSDKEKSGIIWGFHEKYESLKRVRIPAVYHSN